MRVLIFISIICYGAATARSIDKEYDYAEYDFSHPNSNFESHHGGDETSGGKTGYSAGSGLRSIAQGSADQANNAVANQHAAAKQAAYLAQNTLAQAASQASATAQAALAGKQVLLQGLEQQSLEAHQALDGEVQQLQQAKRSAKAAQQAAQQAMNQVQVITAALNTAQGSAEHANQAAIEAAAELASQTSMVGVAKARLESVEEQLKAVRLDFQATQEAARKAASSAQAAHNNAAEAAAHASSAGTEIILEHEVHAAANHNYEYKPSPKQDRLAGY